MADLRNCSKQFIINFIELYRSHPCLWKIKSKEYSDRDMKNNAYDDMITKLKEVDPAATRDSVKKKIDSLRGCFRKELKKVNASKKSGAGAEEVYRPHLWYYNYLLFLTDQEEARESVTNIEEDLLSPEMDQSQRNETFIQSPASALESEESVDIDLSLSNTSIRSGRSKSTTPSVRSTTKRAAVNKADEVLEKVSRKLDICEDKFDIIGRNVAHKLRDLPKDVSVMADKLISDILFEAHMGNITNYSKMNIYDGRNLQLQTTQILQMDSPPNTNQTVISSHATEFYSQGF